MSAENFIFIDFFLLLTEVTSTQESVKRFSYRHNNIWHLHSSSVDESQDSWVDVTSVNFNSKKVHEDEIFGRQDILQFFSGEFKDYKYVKFPQTLGALSNNILSSDYLSSD